MVDFPIRVLMLVPNLRVSNGVASFAMSYYRKLDHSKIKMDFVSYKKIDSPYISEIESNGDRVFFVAQMKHLIRHFRDCANIINGSDYRVIHNNSLLVTLPLMKLAEKKVPHRILHSHSTQLGETPQRERRNRTFIPFLLRTANHYAACSTAAGETLFSDRNFEIIPDVIHVEKYRYNEETRQAVRKRENCEDKVVIGTVGRVTDAKNPFFAVDVIERIVKDHPEIEYWWVGSGALDSELKEYVSKKHLVDKVKLFGSRDDVDELYQAMDLFFMPSKFEGFGMACVEAETSGLPCVVSDVLTREVDVTGNALFLDLDDSADIWASTITNLLQHPIDRASAFLKAEDSICSDLTAGERLTDYYVSL